MIRLILLFGVLFGTDKALENDIPGTYVRKIHRNSHVRQFGRTLTLNCDSTVTATFQGDMMNEKVNGRWTMNYDTLKVIIDEPSGHWRKVNLFLVRRRRLIMIVTDINGEKKSRDKRVLEILYKESKKYAYDRKKKQKCE